MATEQTIGHGVAVDLRPVTPVGIIASRLAHAVQTAELLDQVMGEHGVAGELIEELRAIGELAAGIEPYCEACTTPPSADLAGLAQRTEELDWSGSALEAEMLSGPVEARFLQFLVAMSGARNVLEIGVFTGYSALAIAEALAPGGRLVACELDAAVAQSARCALEAAGYGRQVDLRVGPASETLRELAAAGERFDLIFIDADKSGYLGYLGQLLADGLLGEGGTIVVDNTLLQGQPWTVAPGSGVGFGAGSGIGPGVSDPSNGAAIAAFNAAVAADDRVEQVLVPLRDGVTLIRRRP